MLIYIRGAGDLASGIAMRLFHAGMQVVMSDISFPTAVRRTVSFSEAIRKGSCQVEDITACLAKDASEAIELVNRRKIAVLVDPDHSLVRELKPDAVIDAILAKVNLGTTIEDAPIVIGVGPGFTAGEDCHAVIETKRGHTLGRVIRKGSAIPNTGIPGIIAGYGVERVLRAPADGIFRTCHQIGDLVKAGETVAYVAAPEDTEGLSSDGKLPDAGSGVPVKAAIDGMLRGLLPDGIPVSVGMKSGDVDPRGAKADFRTVSDKALAVGGGALEALLWLSGQYQRA